MMSEDEVIAVFASGGAAPGREVVVGNGDDAAAWVVEPGHAAVATTDSLVEGVHFSFEWSSPRAAGKKLVAVNLSDVAAMGARPRHLFLSVHLPQDFDVEIAREIAAGIHAQCALHDVAILGGNVTRTSGPIVLVATLVGEAPVERLLRRGTCRPGDAIFVTGTLGDARAGLLLALQGEREGELLDALNDPVPRVAAGPALASTRVVRAMCDVSDGLARDLAHLLGGGGSGAVIEAGALPISGALRGAAARLGGDVVAVAVEGGEDYELLFAAPPEAEEVVKTACTSCGVTAARIGVVTEGGERLLRRPDGELDPIAGGFSHFRG